MPGRRLDAFYGRGSAKVRCFKIMYNQLSRPFVLRYFLENEDVRVMHLRRHNLLKVHVSTLLMDKRRELQATAPEGDRVDSRESREGDREHAEGSSAMRILRQNL